MAHPVDFSCLTTYKRKIIVKDEAVIASTKTYISYLFSDLINGILSTSNVINDVPQPKPEVAFPRVPGFRPEAADNPCNAW